MTVYTTRAACYRSWVEMAVSKARIEWRAKVVPSEYAWIESTFSA